MTDFVLVPGAWLGAWAWDEVTPLLREAGHGVHPLSLSGLAEKADRKGAPAPGQETHVRDVVDEIERLDLREVALVGHSYAGIPVCQAAQRLGGRLAHVVLVDANVPADGEPFLSALRPEGRAELEAALAAHGGDWPPPAAATLAGQDLTDEQLALFTARATPHPGASLTEPAALARPLASLPATYVQCLRDHPELRADVAPLVTGGHWRLTRLDTGHWPMLSRPRELAGVLLDAVR